MSEWYEDDLKIQYFYEQLRSQIEHEDELCHQRMTWLIALQSFLFTGYGFSLSAQAVITSAREISPDTKESLIPLISSVRYVMALVGIFVGLAVLIGLIAAILSINRLVRKWYKIDVKHRARFPQIIGNARPSRVSGMLFGMVPLLIMPLASIMLWIRFSYDTQLESIAIYGGVLIFSCIVLIWLGIILGKTMPTHEE